MTEIAKNTAGDITTVLAELDRCRPDDATDRTDAVATLIELAYDELRELAQSLMRSQPTEHTLQPTALVHEAAMRLLGTNGLAEARNRSYFFGAMCRAMRRVLVDHARARRAIRRGGDRRRLALDGPALDATISAIENSRGIDLIELDEALQRLETRSRRQAELVTMRFFGGFDMREIAEHLRVSLGTVENDWRIAKAWLHQELNPSA